MDTMSAFAMGQANRHKEQMVFDWEKAAKLIKESGAECAEAGLAGDWEWTGGTIFEDGKIVEDSYTYLASTWATPQLILASGIIDCFKMQSEVPDWDAETKWPEVAKKIIEENI